MAELHHNASPRRNVPPPRRLRRESGSTGGESRIVFGGLLRLSSSDWFGARILTPVFAEFARAQPHVVVELITGVSHHSLARREADIVFKNRPFDEPEAVSRRLMHIPYGHLRRIRLCPPARGGRCGDAADHRGHRL